MKISGCHNDTYILGDRLKVKNREEMENESRHLLRDVPWKHTSGLWIIYSTFEPLILSLSSRFSLLNLVFRWKMVFLVEIRKDKSTYLILFTRKFDGICWCVVSRQLIVRIKFSRCYLNFGRNEDTLDYRSSPCVAEGNSIWVVEEVSSTERLMKIAPLGNLIKTALLERLMKPAPLGRLKKIAPLGRLVVSL